MVKIRAKQILSSKTPELFFSLFLPKLLSLVSLSAVTVSLIAVSQGLLENSARTLFGNYSHTVLIVSSVIVCSVLIYFFALGEKLFYMHALKASGAVVKTGGGALKTMEFLIFTVVRFLYFLAWAGLFLSPAVLSASATYYIASNGEMTRQMLSVFLSGTAVLTVTGLSFTFITVQRYSLWGYALCRENCGVFSALKLSLEKTEGQAAAIAFFKLSMLPWLILCALVLPTVYVLPYYETAVALRLRNLNRQPKTLPPEPSPAFAAVFRV